MKLITGCLSIVWIMCTLVAFAGGKPEQEKQVKRGASESRLLRGQPGYNFSFSDMDGNPVTLKRLRGKYVYIDVWATWCGPCKAELPFLQKLIKEMEGKKIVFLSLSCDQQRNRWEEFVKNEQLGGIQVYMGDSKKEFLRFFEVGIIPRFILLDKKGKIVNVNMDAPSSKRIKEVLMELKGI